MLWLESVLLRFDTLMDVIEIEHRRWEGLAWVTCQPSNLALCPSFGFPTGLFGIMQADLDPSAGAQTTCSLGFMMRETVPVRSVALFHTLYCPLNYW